MQSEMNLRIKYVNYSGRSPQRAQEAKEVAR